MIVLSIKWRPLRPLKNYILGNKSVVQSEVMNGQAIEQAKAVFKEQNTGLRVARTVDVCQGKTFKERTEIIINEKLTTQMITTFKLAFQKDLKTKKLLQINPR